MAKAKNSTNRVRKAKEMAERSKRALQLKLAGATYPEIAETMGISLSTAHGDVQRALKDIPKDEAAQLRREESMRLDRLHRELWREAIDKDVPLIQRLPLFDRLVKLSDRRSKLLGIDAPQSLEVTGVDLDLDAAVAALVEAAQRAASTPEDDEDEFVDYAPEEIETPDGD